MSMPTGYGLGPSGPKATCHGGKSGHGPAVQERRLNAGLQMLPSGRAAFPVARESEHHRSINQNVPELWSDFSDRGLHMPRGGIVDSKSGTYHGDFGAQQRNDLKAGQVVFVGFAEVDVDGRFLSAGEMDRLMMHAAASKYPCSRPATLDEYSEQQILGLPEVNRCGRDIIFVGPGATGCELFHTNTLGSQKCIVPPGDPLDGNWGAASMYGRKSVLCVYPVQRVRRQQSLTQFGLARSTIGASGRLRRAGSLASMTDKTMWTSNGFGGSSPQAARQVRSDSYFR
eukprot:TRINITY_DN19872_c0_g1_i1.p1 TRINITY_DN19872_c0_g1~~TRINITY_DN19872_c0_g1_i1.p1  ORF type:complete len:303 (-),score=49.17 TRINITY_DN19872_c0_g1_i1:174-1028(-)